MKQHGTKPKFIKYADGRQGAELDVLVEELAHLMPKEVRGKLAPSVLWLARHYKAMYDDNRVNLEKLIAMEHQVSQLTAEVGKYQGWMKEALKSLRHRDIEMEDKEGNWLNVGFINYAKYDARRKVYEIEVSKTIMPHLVELASKFTEYSLTVAISLKSKYSQRFYELACQYRTRRTFFLEQAKLRQMLMLEGKYTQNQDFKRKVIDVAIHELKEAYDAGQCDLWMEFAQEGRGKEVRYNFKIHTKQDDAREQELFGEVRKLALYVYRRCKEIFQRDPKYCERILQHLDFNPDKIQQVFEKLTKMEKDYKGSDLAKLLRWVLREDFDIK